MALRLWLPLNGSLVNQGLDDVAVTNNGATVNDAGKIGKCYEFGTTTNSLSVTPDFIKDISGGCSFVFWVKFTDYGVNYQTVFDINDGNISWNNEIFAFQKNGSAKRLVFTMAGTNGYTSASCVTQSDFELNKWYHFVCVYNPGQMIIYKDGEHEYTYNTTVVPKVSAVKNFVIGAATTAGTYQSKSLLNDFRVYDHVLSLREIKELSKGLVLHYPLNRGGFGQDNLLLNSTIPTSGSGATGITKYITDDGLQKVVAESPNSNWCTFGNHNTTLPLTKGDSFTFSMMIKSPDSTKKPTVYFQSGLGYYSMQGTMSNNWSIIYYTGTWDIDNFTTNLHLGFSGAPGTYYIKYFKLEEGSIATPWAPNPADDLYSAMGLDDDIEYDVSGYGNNSIANGSLSYSNNTPRYNMCSLFDGTKWFTRATTYSEIKSMSAWIKTTKSKATSQFVCADSDSKLCISFYNNCIISYFGSDPGTGSKCSLGNSYIENDWNHIVVVVTGSNTRDVYCNGVKLTPTTNDYCGAASGFFVGTRNTSGTLPFYGYISDIRIYATALSDTDILALYNTPISIANNGTLMTQGEISEV